MRLFVLFLAGTLAMPMTGHADEVSDALAAATAAYAAGDLKATTDQMALAGQGIRARQTEMLNAFLPEAPAGFTREINADYGQGFAVMGGGVGTEATYSSDEGSFTLNFSVDNPMVMSMAGMLGNAAIMAAMGKVVQADGAMLLDQDNSLSALVGNRVLVQAQGMPTAVMLPVVKSIDFGKLPLYDAP